MSFYPRKYGLEQYRYAKSRKDCRCFICGEDIKKGQFRYSNSTGCSMTISLCTKCAECWEKEGGRLGDISRAKKEYITATGEKRAF